MQFSNKTNPFGNKAITQELLDMNEEGDIVAIGKGYIEHPWFNNATFIKDGGSLEEDGKSTQVKFVVVKSWGKNHISIFHSMDANFIPNDYFDTQSHLLVRAERIAALGARLGSLAFAMNPLFEIEPKILICD